MPLVVNGVIIAEATANALTIDGSDVTDMFVDGVQVYNQSLFSATWSGDSLDGGAGISTSGSLYRMISGVTLGAWRTANSGGLDTGRSSVAPFGTAFGFDTTPTTWKAYHASTASIGTIIFGIGAGFSGTSGTAFSPDEFTTSGGLIRRKLGSFISLT